MRVANKIKYQLPNIPNELAQLERWLLWRWVQRPGESKPTKIPINANYYQITDGGAFRGTVKSESGSSTDPATWCEFGKATKVYQLTDQVNNGIGIVLSPPYTGIDLDKCVNPATKEITPAALAIIKRFNSYTEITVSGTGARIWIKAKKTQIKCKSQGWIEVYDSARYLTMSGAHIEGTPATIEERQNELAAFEAELFPPAQAKERFEPTVQLELADEVIVDMCEQAGNSEKFEKLWSGDLSGHNDDHSSADLALCCILAFYSRDEDQIDRLFQASGLMRDKWERADYRDRTIQAALDMVDEQYQPGPEGMPNEWLDAAEATAAHRPRQATPSPPAADGPANKKKKKKKKKVSTVDAIISAVTENDKISLWHCGEEGFATIEGRHHYINSNAFLRWVATTLYRYASIKVSSTQLKTALPIIESSCFEGEECRIFKRIARVDDAIYLDLGKQYVSITADGWKVVDAVPVKFMRVGNFGLLPLPIAGGSVDDLRKAVHTNDENWLLLKGWILDSLKGYGPYIVLVVNGAEGSAKSCLCRTLKNLVDPVRLCPLNNLPRDDEGFGFYANTDHVLAFDNVSKLAEWQSDIICRIAVGAGFRKRKLYTDQEAILVDACCPQILNGIPEFAENSDLLDRAILLAQPAIPTAERIDEGMLQARFAAIHGVVLGGICDMLSEGLASFSSTSVANLPRMADSGKWIASCGLPEWLEGFSANKEIADNIIQEASPIVNLIDRALDTIHPKTTVKWKLEGTAGEVLDSLVGCAGHIRFELSKHFPTDPIRFSGRLTRDEPTLNRLGIEVIRHKSNGKRIITIQRKQGR